MTDDIDTRLEYFQELEHATRMLNHPGESLVLQTDFLYMVERVDICIDYLKAHVSVLSFYWCPCTGLMPYTSDIFEKQKSTYSDSSNV
jgi:Sec34-like family